MKRLNRLFFYQSFFLAMFVPIAACCSRHTSQSNEKMYDYATEFIGQSSRGDLLITESGPGYVVIQVDVIDVTDFSPLFHALRGKSTIKSHTFQLTLTRHVQESNSWLYDSPNNMQFFVTESNGTATIMINDLSDSGRLE